MKNVIIGTSGHIDHGKTTLIRALTGRDTDTLKEEKKRGISIDLGFTYFDLPSGKRAGIVDVPGHEKFIKNMLAGVSGMDIVLLVIAADEGVMPQTIEHLDILSFLDIKKGIIVLTKCDCVDEDFIELVKEDVKDRIKESFCSSFDFIEVDSISGRGISSLVDAIDKLSEETRERNINTPARLNIDRVFTIKGFGTVVTGTLIEGEIKVDDVLTIYPNNHIVKVRSIQIHNKSEAKATAGQRVALNISNIKVEEITRGDVLAAPNLLQESMMIDIKISLVKHSSRKLQYWDRVRVYIGTKEVLARVVVLNKEELNAGEEGYCQLRLEEKIVAKKGDKFVIRFYSPMETIGGGIILDPNARKHKRFQNEIIDSLKLKEKGEIDELIEEIVNKHSLELLDLKTITRYIGEHEDMVKLQLAKLIDSNRIVNINNLYLHNRHFNEIRQKCIDVLTDYHKKNELKKGVLKEELRSKILKELKSKEFEIVVNILCGENLIKIQNNIVSLYEFEIRLNERQLKIKDEIERDFRSNGFTPKSLIEVINNNKEYENIIEILIDDTLIKISEDIVYHKEFYEKSIDLLKEFIKSNKSITLAQFRDLIGASRKFSMALLDDFDRKKITKRIEDIRVLF